MKYIIYNPILVAVIAPYVAANTTNIYAQVCRKMQESLNFYVLGIMMGANNMN